QGDHVLDRERGRAGTLRVAALAGGRGGGQHERDEQCTDDARPTCVHGGSGKGPASEPRQPTRSRDRADPATTHAVVVAERPIPCSAGQSVPPAAAGFTTTRCATGLPASSRQYTVTRASFATSPVDRIPA